MTVTAVCSVYDSVANLYGSPFYAINADVAKRQFQAECVRDADGPMQTHPQDFRLFKLGDFDDETGRFTLHEQPVFLFQGAKAL